MKQEIRIGSEEHKKLFCRVFINTHVPYDPVTIHWPELDEESRERLRSLPFWEEAVSTEHVTSRKVQARASVETDPLLREAIALDGYEEERHAKLLRIMTDHYGIAVPLQSGPPLPADIEWAFLRTGYGECFDSFFAFGLFAIAKDSGFFPPALVDLFEPTVQEEVRHILFFVNWVAYSRARGSLWQRPLHLWRCALGMGLQVWSRVQTALDLAGGNFTLKGHRSINTSISLRSFLELCLRENERRLSLYDRRLLRPQLAPTIAKVLCRVLRRA